MTEREHNQALYVRRGTVKWTSDGKWRVWRKCPCHYDEFASVPFDTEEEAQACYRALMRDALLHSDHAR